MVAGGVGFWVDSGDAAAPAASAHKRALNHSTRPLMGGAPTKIERISLSAGLAPRCKVIHTVIDAHVGLGAGLCWCDGMRRRAA